MAKKKLKFIKDKVRVVYRQSNRYVRASIEHYVEGTHKIVVSCCSKQLTSKNSTNNNFCSKNQKVKKEMGLWLAQLAKPFKEQMGSKKIILDRGDHKSPFVLDFYNEFYNAF